MNMIIACSRVFEVLLPDINPWHSLSIFMVQLKAVAIVSFICIGPRLG